MTSQGLSNAECVHSKKHKHRKIRCFLQFDLCVAVNTNISVQSDKNKNIACERKKWTALCNGLFWFCLNHHNFAFVSNPQLNDEKYVCALLKIYMIKSTIFLTFSLSLQTRTICVRFFFSSDFLTSLMRWPFVSFLFRQLFILFSDYFLHININMAFVIFRTCFCVWLPANFIIIIIENKLIISSFCIVKPLLLLSTCNTW